MPSTTTADTTDKQLHRLLDAYRAEPQRLNHSRGTIHTDLCTIRRLWRIMEARGITVGELIPELAGELVRDKTTQISIHADLQRKEKALARMAAPEAKPGR